MKKTINTIFQNRIVLIMVMVMAMAFNRSGSFYSQSWQWAKKAAGTSGEMGSVSCTDQAGNTIATGVYTSNPVQIGTYTLGNIGTGTADAFIAKYDPNGAVLWAQRLGGTNQEVITGITTDASGNIYVLGNFSSPSISNSTLSAANNSAGTMDVFVAVFNSTGAILSLKNYGGSGNDFGGGCVFSNSVNSLFISGRFNSILASFGSVNLTNSDGSGLTSDIYLARITSFTTFNWGTSTGSPNSNDASVDLAIDASSNPHFSGTFNNGTTFTTNIASNTLTSIGGQVGWGTFSDRRLKTGIKKNTLGLAFIQKLQPVDYSYATKGQENSIYSGLIAQDVEEVLETLNCGFSGLVKPQNDADFYSIRYAEFVIPLINAVKEQQQQIEKLEEKNDLLEIKMKELEKKLNVLLEKSN